MVVEAERKGKQEQEHEIKKLKQLLREEAEIRQEELPVDRIQ